jgi:hypothetical protein
MDPWPISGSAGSWIEGGCRWGSGDSDQCHYCSSLFFLKKTGNRDLLLLAYLFTLLLLLGETEQTGSVLFL